MMPMMRCHQTRMYQYHHTYYFQARLDPCYAVCLLAEYTARARSSKDINPKFVLKYLLHQIQ